MVASAEQGYAKEWQDAVLEDAAAHAAAHGLDTPFRPPKSWRVERQSVPRRFREMTSDHTWQRLDTVAKAAAIVELPGKASYPIDPADVKKYIHLLHLKDKKNALLGPGGYTSKTGAILRRTYLQPAVARLFADHAGLLKQALEDSKPSDATPAVARSKKPRICDITNVAERETKRANTAEKREAAARRSEEKAIKAKESLERRFDKEVQERVKKCLPELKAAEKARLEGVIAALEEQVREKERARVVAVKDAVDAVRTRLLAEHKLAKAPKPSDFKKVQKQRADAHREVKKLAVELDKAISKNEASAAAAEPSQAQPWVPGVESSRGMPFDVDTRLLVHNLLTKNVFPAEMGDIIAAVADAILGKSHPAALLKMRLPSTECIKRMRYEVGPLNDIITAQALGKAKRVACHGADGSPIDGDDFCGNVARLENQDGFLEDWALGIHQVLDKTAKGEAQAIKEEVYDKLAAAAESFKQAVAVAFGDDAAKDVADPSMVEITRLVGSVAMSDNASTATATSREIGVLVQRAVVAKLGPDVVEKMTPAAILEATATFWGTCERHLHNTFLDGAVKKEKKLLESRYADKIAAMPADQRPTLDLTVICRAVAKAFGTGQNLYGKTLVETDWLPFVAAECKGKYMPAFKRTDRGVRQDDLTTSARRVWWLRPEIVRCLRQNAEKSENLLRSHLAMELSSKPIVAGLYARTLLDERFTQPWTFFAASEELDWDLTDMCKVHEATLAACQIPRSQWPQTWLNPDWDPYAVLMNVPAYREWRRRYLARNGVAEQRAEIFTPKDQTNIDAQEEMMDFLEALLEGVKGTMLGGEATRRLGDGDLAKPTRATKAAFKGVWRTTNRLESLFAVMKAYKRIFDNLPSSLAADIACAKVNHIHGRPAGKYVGQRKSRPRKRAGQPRPEPVMKKPKAAPQGRAYTTMTEGERAVAVKESRRRGPARHAECKAREAKGRELQREKTKAAQEKARAAVADKYAKAASSYEVEPVVADANVSRTTPAGARRLLAGALKDLSKGKQHDYLKAQISRIYSGMGHVDLKPKSWTSEKDASIGSKGSPENIAFLGDQLLHALKILKEEKRSLAKNVPAIVAARGETIGEPTAQRAALDEEEQKRRRDLAEAVDAPQAKKQKKQKKRRIPTPTDGDRVQVVHFFDGDEVPYWCPGYVGGSMPCSVDGKPGISYYVFYDAQGANETAPDAWERFEAPLFEGWGKEGGWRFEPADNDADEPEESFAEFEEPVDESEDQDGGLDVRPLEQDDDDDDVFADP